MTTMSGHRSPSRSDYQANGMPPGMAKFTVLLDSGEDFVVITWADSSPAQVAATLDAQRMLSEVFPGCTVVGVANRSRT